uniref:ABC transporter domain-containing protein n=1 Tax=Meloidogyne enterolobii TaxID=390850 RepID=A0A6V7UIQ3_MELEN|nr:unnamed protein product [Meloidogyne enterolobii]
MAKSGQLVALMGASGAGKTTLLNTLLSRNLTNLTVQGKVLVNGEEMGKQITFVSGYVQQDELFMGTLTVKEHLIIQARLRLVGSTERQIKKRVSEILNDLGLHSCRHARIGSRGIKKGISGGEARRLLFACELLSNPQIIFADEPTTGLDSSMAESVINVMKKLAQSGRTVICTIHQPSSTIYRQFDMVIFLANGRLAYFGEPSKTVDYLNSFGYPCPRNYNPADAMIQCLSIEMYNEEICKERIGKICDDWEVNENALKLKNEIEEQNKIVVDKPERRKRATFGVQTSALLKRSILDNIRNPGLAKAKLSQKLIMGIFIGLLYFQTSPQNFIGISNLNGAMFYIVVELTYSTLFGIITFMPADFNLIVREYHDGLYNLLAYFVARICSYIPLFAIDGIVLVGSSYWMTGLVPNVGRFGIALGIAVLIEQSAAAFGIMLSTACPSYPVAISIAGPILTVLSLTGGLFANVGELPSFISWVQYLSWFRYGFEAFAISQWEGALGEHPTKNCTNFNNQTIACPTATSVLQKLSFNPGMFYFDLGAMVLCTFICYFVGFVGLYIRVLRAR